MADVLVKVVYAPDVAVGDYLIQRWADQGDGTYAPVFYGVTRG